ncbi:MAG: acetyl-CoA hydrolase/transferase family protein [Chloroflexi bacterium]|nr:acetyl-CoA hydrolase/transferase family protein [Chloroflexota bacterium]
MDWRKRYADKLRTPEEAVADVASGQAITVGMLDGMPPSVCRALSNRAAELEDVSVFHFVGAYAWFSFNEGRSFRQITPFTTNVDRAAVREGAVEYLPAAMWRSGRLPYGAGPFDYHLCIVSPPDADGWCSFGSSVWMNPTFADNSRVIIAEVDERAIRTAGGNRIHVDRIERLVDPDPTISAKVRAAMTRAQDRTEEETAAAEVICTLVGLELVRDGDTVQIGAGAISAALAPYLAHRRELGIHTELLPGGLTELVEQGVVTGEHKVTHPGKVVATGAALIPREELDYIDGNPTFELYDFTYTDDSDLLNQEPRLVAVNNAMQVDLTGQVNSEAVGPWPYTGPGGQTAFATAAAHSEDGRSVIVLPSSYLRDGERRSRIVLSLDEGAPVTVPRSAVDNVVTEWGIATLRGKTIRQRIGELLAVAHPDCQPQLKEDVARLYGWRY